ncbi:MAG: SDR family NAD(P)-dependent oxidoreductase [Sphaerimonospora mesophila]
MNKVTSWALVTGGSSGIGLEFSHQLAAEGYNVILASRDGNRLTTTAEQLRQKYRVQVETISVDLANTQDIARLADRICDENRLVEVLVNDAGFAVRDSLLAEDTSRQMAAFSVMAEAILKLSGAAARTMAARGGGRIINVASTSAWLFAGNYSALKRWVVVYTESLALELRGSGVTATAVCPSWVKTDFHKNAGVDRPDVPSWLWVPVETVVRSALSASSRGKSRVIPTFRWKVAIFILKHCEPFARIVSKRMVTKRLAELEQKRNT